jgi:hypothetical protein
MPEHESDTAMALRKTLRMLVVSTVILYLVLIGLSVKIYLDGRETNEALCTFRVDLITRVTQSITFLSEHPKGAPGIPVKTIVDGVNNQVRTINALSGLRCTTPLPVPTPIAPQKGAG